MTPEEKILTYSILSLVGMFVPSLHHKAVETVVKTLGFIVSLVFYCLAISELKKIKIKIHYKLSIAFLTVTTLIFAMILLLICKRLIPRASPTPRTPTAIAQAQPLERIAIAQAQPLETPSAIARASD